MRREHRQRGVTLVELVLAIVIMSIAVGGVLMAYVTMVARSADPLIDVQAVAIAEGYLDEILARPVAGPSDTSARARYAIVDDYDALTPGPPTDPFGTPMPGLSSYTVTVSIGPDAFGAGGRSVTVAVSHPSGRVLQLRGHRIDF